MRGFRRAQLRGSDELFQPTQEGPVSNDHASTSTTAAEPVSVVPSAPPPESRTVRLTDDEITLLVDALQKLKFPKPAGRPPVHEYERFEELRQKLLASL